MLQPTEGNVLIELAEKKETIKGTNIIIPEVAREKELGFGIARSGDYKDKKVYFQRYAGDDVEFEGKNYVIIDEEYLIAILED